MDCPQMPAWPLGCEENTPRAFLSSIKIYFYYILYFIYAWERGDQRTAALSFYHVGLGNQTQAVKLGPAESSCPPLQLLFLESHQYALTQEVHKLLSERAKENK